MVRKRKRWHLKKHGHFWGIMVHVALFFCIVVCEVVCGRPKAHRSYFDRYPEGSLLPQSCGLPRFWSISGWRSLFQYISILYLYLLLLFTYHAYCRIYWTSLKCLLCGIGRFMPYVTSHVAWHWEVAAEQESLEICTYFVCFNFWWRSTGATILAKQFFAKSSATKKLRSH